MKKFERKCPVCNKDYIAYGANQKYCSVECRNRSKFIVDLTYEIKKCKVCGKVINPDGHLCRKIYCSEKCKREGQLNRLRETLKSTKEAKKVRVGRGKSFVARQNDQEYLSTVCRLMTMNNQNILSEERRCECCGSIFVWSSSKPGQKYCSLECWRLAQKEKKDTKKRMKNELNKAVVEEHVRRVVTDLISRAKKAKELSIGRTYDYWLVEEIGEETREKVLDRDHYRCQICGSLTNLFLHCIVNHRNGGDYSAENLITLCDSCHRHIDTGDLEYAFSRCCKNAHRNRRLETEPGNENRNELLSNSIYILRNLFSEFSAYYPDESEYLKRLDTVIDTLERIIWN